MSEHPVLFKGDMVQAVLDGRKTQTRRVVTKPHVLEMFNDMRWGKVTTKPEADGHKIVQRAEVFMDGGEFSQEEILLHCPYGKVGDKLWVRENILLRRENGGPYYDILYCADNTYIDDLESHKLDDWFEGYCDWYNRGKAKQIIPSIHTKKELARLQVELVRLQEWVKHKKLRVIVIFEGRDTAGKGGTIKRITERVSPRVFRVVALPAPTEREKTQMYYQRYIAHLPAGGEIVLFDRSWYNRAGVEHVMGYCTEDEYLEFLRTCPNLELSLVRSGIILIKFFLDVSEKRQELRFQKRLNDPLRQWKLSPMDLESRRRWWDYTAAIDKMLVATDTEVAPWYVVRTDDKRRARLNCIAHLLSKIPYKKMSFEKPKLPARRKKPKGVPDAPMYKNIVPDIY